jgi:hypothetical protein
MDSNSNVETVNINGEDVRVMYIVKRSTYTDAQKRAIYKYIEKNRDRVNEQTATRQRRYYRTKVQKMIDEKNALMAWYELCNINYH